MHSGIGLEMRKHGRRAAPHSRHRGRPRDGRAALVHLGGAGLLWATNGGRILELHRGWAVLELPPNGSRRIIDRRRVDAANATLPWRFNLGPPKVSQAI